MRREVRSADQAEGVGDRYGQAVGLPGYHCDHRQRARKGNGHIERHLFLGWGTEYTTWGKKGAGGTVTTSVTYLVVSSTLCSKADIQVVESSNVTPATSAAMAVVGETGSSTVCVAIKDAVTNTKGSDVIS